MAAPSFLDEGGGGGTRTRARGSREVTMASCRGRGVECWGWVGVFRPSILSFHAPKAPASQPTSHPTPSISSPRPTSPPHQHPRQPGGCGPWHPPPILSELKQTPSRLPGRPHSLSQDLAAFRPRGNPKTGLVLRCFRRSGSLLNPFPLLSLQPLGRGPRGDVHGLWKP